MADKHPYTSGSAGLVQAVAQLRKTFPNQVTAETFKKLGIAPNNETYVLSVLRFIGIIDAEGKKTTHAGTVFNQHEDVEFQRGFANLVKSAYSQLFDLHGDQAWHVPAEKLIGFFRSADQTSSIVGRRQASTFQALAGLGGQIESAPTKPNSGTKKAAVKASAAAKKVVPSKDRSPANSVPDSSPPSKQHVGLTVRIEVNLPIASDQETYDRIFKSIRENLING